MEPEQQRWETLQFHLTAGRMARDVGDRDQALEHIDAALAIDPDFVAAHMLRLSLSAPQESKTAEPDEAAPAASVIPQKSIDRPQVSLDRYAQLEARVRRRRIGLCLDKARQAIAERRFPDAQAALDEVMELDSTAPGLDVLAAELAAVRPGPNDWDRMDTDRDVDDPIAVDHRTAVDDRTAEDDRIAEMFLTDRIAIEDHVSGQPEVSGGDRAATGGHRGPWTSAPVLLVGVVTFAAVFAAVFATWPRPHESESRLARSVEGSASVVAPAAPASTAEVMAPPPPPVSVEHQPPASPVLSPPVAPLPSPPPTALPLPAAPSDTPRAAARETDIDPPSTAVAPRPEASQPVRALPPRIADGPIPLTVFPERAAEPSAAASPGPTPGATPPPRPIEPAAAPPPAPAAATSFPVVDDGALVRDTLQRYRRAYSNLDAQLAHAVFPVLDEGALAHAFANLRSQSLEFDSCSVDIRGESARAVCRGSARYVPNIGSSTPRTERRVWTFMLEKTAGDWKIANARTDR